MTLDAQTIIAGLIVLACAIYAIRQIAKPFTSKGESGCGGDCSCDAVEKSSPKDNPTAP